MISDIKIPIPHLYFFDYFEFNGSSYPLFVLKEDKKLPETPVLYFLFNRFHKLIYIGKTTNLCERLVAHKFRIGKEFLFFSFSDNYDKEAEFIDYFKPRLNSQHAVKIEFCDTCQKLVSSYGGCYYNYNRIFVCRNCSKRLQS